MNTDMQLSPESVRKLEQLAATAARTSREREQPSPEVFINLLGGISACRIMEGIPAHMGYEESYFCGSGDDRRKAAETLRDMFGITGPDSLEEAMDDFDSDEAFRDFYGFWKGYPPFDPETLEPEGRDYFRQAETFAGQLYPFTGSKGFLAWDINEKTGLCRRALACGLISRETFEELTRPLMYRAAAHFENWGEYAVSCVCGAAFFLYTRSGFDREQAEKAIEINSGLAAALLAPEGAWSRYGWLSFSKKKFAKSASEMLPLVPRDFEGPRGCFISDRITVDGREIGYMYREDPDPGRPDSGWRFLAGDEDDAYLDDPENVGIYSLNTACNADPDVIPYLNRRPCVAFVKREDGTYSEEAFLPPEE